MKNKYVEKKRSFNCDNELWEEFGETVDKDKCFKNKSEALRYLVREYIKREKSNKE